MRRKLQKEDWQEIFYALELKASEIERGTYDAELGEAKRRNSETARWAAHLRRIMAMNEAQ